jgi:long-chain acyl-CoA synthetase
MAEAQSWIEHPRRWALSEPGRPAVVFPASGETVTYGELDRAANRIARFFRSRGLARGDHIALLIENHPRLLEIAWAAHNSGLYYTAVSWRFRVEEVRFIVENSGAHLVLFTPQQSALVDELRGALPGVEFVAVGSDAPDSLDSLVKRLPDTPIPDESRGSDMLYSSGSTGRPKGIKQKLPDAGVDGLSKMFAIYRDMYAWGEDTVYLMPCPLYHSGPLRFAMAMQQVGATLLVMDKFDAEAALKLVEEWRVTHAHWVPTMLVRLLKLPEEVRARYDLSSLRTVVHGAAPIAPDAKRAAIDWLGPILEESYGGTEGNGLTMISSAEWLEHPGSVGRPFLGAVHILDDDGRELPPGEIGTIWFSGGPGFSYHQDPDRTAKAYDEEGRSTLGDIGYVDSDGYLYLTDRKDHMVISAGVNVFPQEAENVLIGHPKVADACVFGVPDPDMGEVLHAVVQPLDPDRADSGLEAELIAYCRGRMATIKCPRTLEFTPQLPRHDTGKIYSRLVKQAWLQRSAKQQA